MSGLWLKDLLVLKRQSLALILNIIVATFVLALFKENGIFIGMMVFGITISLVTLNLLTYDQNDNGLVYIFSLPITIKEYIIQKYSIVTLMNVLGIVVMIILSLIFNQVQNWQLSFMWILTSAYLVGLVVLGIILFTLHFQLSHGPESGAVAMSALGSVNVVILGVGWAIFAETNWGRKIVLQIYQYFTDHGTGMLLIGLSLLLVVVISLAAQSSIKYLTNHDI
ncbi:ABC-2 transporter permease [Weissella paramesenteroides]|uniref:ABC-2 transporter permease n=1 Tax=Weissella paramesenteroides TaxID=1249 RepID=UPI0013D993BD|nr:ABC-2 transporter permease [Weissella paramesenteroides]NEZ89020.1 ABC-2 transporter permease [Weissella paramesenteroides]NFB03345.1 ABC-2 transporter permease [Weissella paramesenteroides]